MHRDFKNDLFLVEKLRIWSHLLNKSLMENFIFYYSASIGTTFSTKFVFDAKVQNSIS